MRKITLLLAFFLNAVMFSQTTPPLKNVLGAGNDANGKKITGLANGASAQDAVTVSQLTASTQTLTLTGGVTGSGTSTVVATVITNANLTGPIISEGNATAIASQTGAGSTFAMSISPVFTGTVTAAAINGNRIQTGTGSLNLSTYSLTSIGNGSISGTNTGDQDLTGYVPYSGATGDVDLNQKQLTGISQLGVGTSSNDAEHYIIINSDLTKTNGIVFQSEGFNKWIIGRRTGTSNWYAKDTSGNDRIVLRQDSTATFNTNVIIQSGKTVAIGVNQAETGQKLEVNGGGVFGATSAARNYIGYVNTKATFISSSKRNGTPTIQYLLGRSLVIGSDTSVYADTSLSALVIMSSTTKGLLVPRMTTTQRNAIVSPATGLLIYNTTTGLFNAYNSGWGAVGLNMASANLTANASYTTTFTGFNWTLSGGAFTRLYDTADFAIIAKSATNRLKIGLGGSVGGKLYAYDNNQVQRLQLSGENSASTIYTNYIDNGDASHFIIGGKVSTGDGAQCEIKFNRANQYGLQVSDGTGVIGYFHSTAAGKGCLFLTNNNVRKIAINSNAAEPSYFNAGHTLFGTATDDNYQTKVVYDPSVDDAFTWNDGTANLGVLGRNGAGNGTFILKKSGTNSIRWDAQNQAGGGFNFVNTDAPTSWGTATGGLYVIDIASTLTSDQSAAFRVRDRNLNDAYRILSETSNNKFDLFNYGGGSLAMRFQSNGNASYINSGEFDVGTASPMGYAFGVTGTLGITGVATFASTINSTVAISTVSNSVSGSTLFSQSLAGSSGKQIRVYMNAATGTATYTFPTAFSYLPGINPLSGLALGLVTSLSTTSVTITGATTTGWILLEGY